VSRFIPKLLVEVAICFYFERRENLIFRVTAQKLESVGKVSELCVTDIYSEFVKSFHIQRGQNRQLIHDEIGGAGKFV